MAVQTETNDADTYRAQCDAYARRIVELEQQVSHLRDVLSAETLSCLPLRMRRFTQRAGGPVTVEIYAKTQEAAIELLRRRCGSDARIVAIDGISVADDGKTVKYVTGGRVES